MIVQTAERSTWEMLETGDQTEAIVILTREGSSEEGDRLTLMRDEDGRQIGYFFSDNLKGSFDISSKRKHTVVRMTLKVIHSP